MIQAGVSITRLNFAHGSFEDHAARIDRIRAAERATGGHIAILADLRSRAPREGSAAWRARAEAVLDSLSLGGETAEASCALIINFFSRANPDQGSWPWVYWCGEREIELELDAIVSEEENEQ